MQSIRDKLKSPCMIGWDGNDRGRVSTIIIYANYRSIPAYRGLLLDAIIRTGEEKMIKTDEIRDRLEKAVLSPHVLIYVGIVIGIYLFLGELGLSIFGGFVYLYLQKKYDKPKVTKDPLLCVKIVHYTLLGVLLVVTPLLWLVVLVMLIIILCYVLLTKHGRGRWNIWKF